MKILFVENHPRFSHVTIKTFLASHVVTTAPSLAAARAELSTENFDFVLVDYDLDDGKGTELVSELSEQADRPLLIAVSSHDRGNEALSRAGVDAVCSKLNFANIEAVMSQAVRGVRG